MQKILEAKLKDAKSLPFLFIGSGLSRRYLDLEDWPGLIKLFAAKAMSGNEFAYRIYDNKAKQSGVSPESILPAISEYVEEDFDNISLSSGDYAEFREVHKDEIHAGKSPFKIALAEHFKKAEEKFSSSIQLFSWGTH